MTTRKINNSTLYPELKNFTPSPSSMNVNTPNTKPKIPTPKTPVKNSRLSVRTRVAKPKTTVKTATTKKTTAAKKTATAKMSNVIEKMEKLSIKKTTGTRKRSPTNKPTSAEQNRRKFQLTKKQNFKYNNKTKIVSFKLPINQAKKFKNLWEDSDQQRYEYAGILGVKHTSTQLYYLEFVKFQYKTSYQRGEVSGNAAKFATTDYVSMHSHPSFLNTNIPENVIINKKKYYLTTPSSGDFDFYTASIKNPNVRKNSCNIVLDKHGFWVVDLLDIKRIFSGREIYERIHDILEKSKNSSSMKIEPPQLTKPLVTKDNYLYWECSSLNNWKTLTKRVGDIIFKEFGIKMKYHFWSNSNSNLSYEEAELRFKIA